MEHDSCAALGMEKTEVKEMILNDYRIMMESREASLLGRRISVVVQTDTKMTLDVLYK